MATNRMTKNKQKDESDLVFLFLQKGLTRREENVKIYVYLSLTRVELERFYTYYKNAFGGRCEKDIFKAYEFDSRQAKREIKI